MHWTGKVSPVAFSIGKVTVAWYGIFITVAMVTALLISVRRVKRINVSSDDMLVLFLIAIPMAVIFARLGYVVSNYKDYFVKPYDWNAFVNTIAIWKGGLTIMWGVPGGCLGALIWSKIYKKNIIKVTDIVFPTVLLAQAMGRWGNFFNQELYGQPITNPSAQWFPLGVYIASEGGWFQATFFYEMVLNVIGFIVLSILVKRIAVTGFGSLAYFAWYCTVRGVMEIFRSETNAFDKKMGFNTVMVFSFVMAVLFIAGLVTVLVVKKKRGGRIWYKNGIPPLPPEEKKEEATLTLK